MSTHLDETDPTAADAGALWSRTAAVVDRRVDDLQVRYLNREHRRNADAVATLARLRRGAGTEPGRLIDILDQTLLPSTFPPPSGDEPSPEERAVHVAMTSFAVHQQSRGEKMHRRSRGLGTALRALHDGDTDSLPAPLIHRFTLLGTADSFTELTYHLRGAIQLLRAGQEPLDYGRLAGQLVLWQRPGPDRVRLDWGRGFWRTRRPGPPDATSSTHSSNDQGDS